MKGELDANGVFFLVPLTLYVLISILSVEIPEVEDDRMSNKRTQVAPGSRLWFCRDKMAPARGDGFFPCPPGIVFSPTYTWTILLIAIRCGTYAEETAEEITAIPTAMGVITASNTLAVLVDRYLFSLTV